MLPWDPHSCIKQLETFIKLRTKRMLWVQSGIAAKSADAGNYMSNLNQVSHLLFSLSHLWSFHSWKSFQTKVSGFGSGILHMPAMCCTMWGKLRPPFPLTSDLFLSLNPQLPPERPYLGAPETHKTRGGGCQQPSNQLSKLDSMEEDRAYIARKQLLRSTMWAETGGTKEGGSQGQDGAGFSWHCCCLPFQ